MAIVKIDSLAALKRAIKIPGVRIQVLEHWQEKLRNTVRTPIVTRASGKPGVQTNGYYFLDAGREMWCALPKVTELEFNIDGSVTFHPKTDRSWRLLFEVQS